ncbi:MAG TPA: VOC family protein [Pseudolabrys sp.]|jgi:PhnB protein|nr:VOC family protein [Pseudolabrys sp.]
MNIQPYLFFDGRCDEALAFYEKALGAQIEMLMRFKEAPPQQSGEGCGPMPDGEKVMHASFKVGEATIMASDGMAQGKPEFKGISLSITAKNDADAKRFFDALSDGGKVQQPLMKTFFASSFGMVADKFGVGWMVVATP